MDLHLELDTVKEQLSLMRESFNDSDPIIHILINYRNHLLNQLGKSVAEADRSDMTDDEFLESHNIVDWDGNEESDVCLVLHEPETGVIIDQEYFDNLSEAKRCWTNKHSATIGIVYNSPRTYERLEVLRP